MRVAIVDDDEWVRRGRADALRERPSISEAVVIDHTGALAWTDEWDRFDVVVLDAHDRDATWDRFSGVRVAERIRARRTPAQTRIVVVTGHHANDLLRIRMAEAGADLIFAHDQVRSIDALVAAVEGRGGEAPAEVAGMRLNETLRFIEDRGYAEAFEADGGQKALPVSRRRLITLRSRAGKLLGRREPPSWRSLSGLVNRARGEREAGAGGSTPPAP